MGNRMIAATCFLSAVCASCGGNDKSMPPRDPGQGILDSAGGNFEPAKEPDFTADTRYAAGQLAESQDDSKRAISQYEEALGIDPKHLPSVYRLGVLNTQTKNFSGAFTAWQKYVELTKGSAKAYANLGYCYDLSNNPKEAEAAYLKGIERDPANVPCRVNYGLMLARRGHPALGLTQLQTVLKPAEAHYNLASLYEEQGYRERARVEYNKAIELDPAMKDAQTRLAALDR